MRHTNGSILYGSCGAGGRGTKMKNRCSSAECKCSPPVVNVHHYQCPLMRTPCPLHGYPFIYNIKSKKTPPDQCLVISFHPSLKTDKLFEPVKTFLNQTCEPDTKINFQYHSPRQSETYCEDFKHRQVQTNPEDFKKLTNSYFVEKTKTFFSDKTNKMKKLKQCFNSPCSSVVHKSRSCTAVKEKLDRIFREETGDGYPNKSKLEKRIKAACYMKSEESSHFLYKRDFGLSDGEKSSKEKIDSDFITRINNNRLDHNVFEIRSRKGFSERVERVSANMRPYFTYTSFVSPNPVKEKVQIQTQTEEVSDFEKANEESQNPDDHSDEFKEDKEEHNNASPDEGHTKNISSDSSSSVYFTPFIFVPGGNEKEVEHQGVQTVNKEPERSYQWVQTIEYFHETVNNKNQIENSEIIVAQANFIKTTETQTSPIFVPEACICDGPSDEKTKEKPVKKDVAVQTLQQRRSTLLYTGFEFRESAETLAKVIGVKEKSVEAIESVSVGVQTQEKSDMLTVVYHEPEMKFLIREESSENQNKGFEVEESRSMGVQTEETTDKKEIKRPESEESRSKRVQIQETRSISALSFFRTERALERVDKEEKVEESKVVGVQTQESEMKFLSRPESTESVREGKELQSTGVQTETIAKPVTVIYFEPETKPLRRKDESGKRGVLFNDENQIKEIESRTEDKSVGTEQETLEESDRGREKCDSAYLITSQDKETQANSNSDTSQSYFNGSDASNATYVVKSYLSEESEQIVVKNWNKSRSEGDMMEKKKCNCLTKADQVSPPSCQCNGTNPNGSTFVGVYHSKKKTYPGSNPPDSTKDQQSKPEATKRKQNENNNSFADLSDLVRIIDENFKKLFDRPIEMCECQQTKVKKPTANKEVITDISGDNDFDVILQMATRSMANAPIPDCLPNLEEMPLSQSTNPDQEPPPSICKVCSKVMSMTSVSIGTNTPDGSYIQTKMQEVDMGTYCEDFPIDNIQKASCSKPKSTEQPSTSKGKSGGIKSVRMSTKTFVTKFEKPPESIENRPPAPTHRRNVTYWEPFSNSTTSLQKDLRRAQKECGTKPKPSRPTPSPRSRPTPKPRQTQLPQSRPQVVTRLIPDAYCGNIMATITTRQTPSYQTQERCPTRQTPSCQTQERCPTRQTPSCQSQERCVFEPSSTSCDIVNVVCPMPPRSNPESCFQRIQPSKEPDPKQNHMTYHVTLSPPLSKDIIKLFQRKLKKISKSESSDCVSDSSEKQKRNHDAESDCDPIVKRIKSVDKTNIFDTNLLEHENIGYFEFGRNQTDIIFKFLMNGENEPVYEEESPQLTKDSGFVWVPFPTSQLFSIRQVSSSEETGKSKETIKEVGRTRSHVLFKKLEENNRSNSLTKKTCHQNLDYTGEKNLTRKVFRCSSCKSLAFLQVDNSEIIEKPKNSSTNFKLNLKDSCGSLVFTPRSHSLVETASWDPIHESSSRTDEQINFEQKHVESVSSKETTEQGPKFIELYSEFLSGKSDANIEMNSNQVETCHKSEHAS